MNKGELIERISKDSEALEITSHRSAELDAELGPGRAQEGRQGDIGWLRYILGWKA